MITGSGSILITAGFGNQTILGETFRSTMVTGLLTLLMAGCGCRVTLGNRLGFFGVRRKRTDILDGHHCHPERSLLTADGIFADITTALISISASVKPVLPL